LQRPRFAGYKPATRTEDVYSHALAYAGLAAACITLADSEEARRKAHDAVARALELDPALPEAQLASGWVKLHLDWDWPAARSAFQSAIARNPNLALAHAANASLLTTLGHPEEAIREMQTALRIDPTSSVLNSDYSWTLYCARHYDEAVAHSHKILQMDANSFFGHYYLGKAYVMQQKYPEGVTELKRTVELARSRSGGALAELGRAYALAGQQAEALKILATLKKQTGEGSASPYALAVLYASLGDKDLAFQFLESAYRARYNRLAWIKVEPDLDPLRSDLRFSELLKRMRL